MPLFDGYIAVDWSANAEPVRGENSIWIAVCDANGMREPINPGTRHEAMEHIENLLNEANEQGHRLICGFDFAFGYPEGTAQMLTGQDSWDAVWRRISNVIQDGPDNANNRFEAAAQLNEAFAGEGPFWGMPTGLQIEGSQPNKPDPWGPNLPPNRRYAEGLVPRAQEVWKLFYPGNVGSQALMGIASLEGLRQRRTDVQIWPFQPLGEGRHHMLVEIYPSLIDPCPGDEVLDARQVKAVAETLRELDRRDKLEQYLLAPENVPDRVRHQVLHEEGAILGMDNPAGFRAAAQATPCRGAGAVPQGAHDMQYIEEDARHEFQLAVPPYVPRHQQPVFQELQRRLGPDLGAVTIDQIIEALDWLEANDPDQNYKHLVYLRAFLECIKGWWETNDEWDFGQAFLWAVHMTSAMLPGN